MRLKLLLSAVALIGIVSCSSIPELPLPPPIPVPTEQELSCLPDDTFAKVIRMRERIITLEEIIKSTH